MSRLRRSRTFVALAVAVLLSTALGIPVVADLNLILGASAQVAYTAGDGVNVRNAPGLWAEVITTLPESFEVSVIDGPVEAEDGTFWYLVNADGSEGWVIHNYLALPGGVSEESSDYIELASGITAHVANTDGYGLRLRSTASYDGETLVVMSEGSTVDVVETGYFTDDGSEWWKIAYQEIVGFAAAAYLSQSAEAAPVEESAPVEVVAAPVEETIEETVAAPESNGSLAPGSTATVSGTNGQGVNLRYEWGYVSGVATVLSEGAVVYVIDGPIWDAESTAWYQVDSNGTIGWIHGGYLVAASGDTPSEDGSNPEPSVAETPEPPAVGATGGDAVGQAIVAEGLRYVGLPYVWGGTTPAGFDCSGFTHYVLTNVLGYNFTRDMHQQVVSGSYVDSANLQPGDLVFFENTYTWGLSHVGIYIGDGQFVHAGSESTGVLVSDLWDDYWGSRYYSARRVRS